MTRKSESFNALEIDTISMRYNHLSAGSRSRLVVTRITDHYARFRRNCMTISKLLSSLGFSFARFFSFSAGEARRSL
jgi:hypothetical protein